MNARRAPEPWKHDGLGGIFCPLGLHIGDAPPDDAGRIVACVNAMKGLNPEAVGE